MLVTSENNPCESLKMKSVAEACVIGLVKSIRDEMTNQNSEFVFRRAG